jgi:hypothetical protein
VTADRLADREHVILVEGAIERGTAMTGGAKGDPLLTHRRIGPLVVIGVDQPLHID